MSIRSMRLLSLSVLVSLVTVLTAVPAYAFDGGTGTNGDPYQLSNCVQLQSVREDLSAWYVQTQDIDCTDTKNWNGGKGFDPIGGYPSDGNPFTGGFDGDGYKIKGLTIIRADDLPAETSGTDEHYVGLFGYSDGAMLTGINLTSAKIKGYEAVGGIVGHMKGGELRSSSVNLNIQDNSCNPGHCVWARYGQMGGGLVGVQEGGLIYNSSTGGPVKGSGNVIGGLVGYMHGGATLSRSRSSSNIDGGGYLGGAVGQVVGSNNIDKVYATGNVTAIMAGEVGKAGYVAGGLIGETYGGTTITRSHATGNVHGDIMFVGGFAGNLAEADVRDSYATGNVDSGLNGINGYNTGGFAGQIANSHVRRSYASGNVSADTYNAGGFAGTATMQAGYTLSDSFAFGHVEGAGSVGAFIGDANGLGQFENNYYDIYRSGSLNCLGSGSDPSGCTGVNGVSTYMSYFFDEDNEPYPAAGGSVWDSDIWYFSGSQLPVHNALNASPELNSPTAQSVQRNLKVDVNVPEQQLAGTVRLVLSNGATAFMIGLAEMEIGNHTLTINSASPATSAGVTYASVGSIPDGEYTVTFAYQPFDASPAVSDSVQDVTITSESVILCEQFEVTDTTATGACTVQPDEYGTTNWQVRYKEKAATSYASVTLSDTTDSRVLLTGLKPGTEYWIEFKPTNSYVPGYGWGRVEAMTTGIPLPPTVTPGEQAVITVPQAAQAAGIVKSVLKPSAVLADTPSVDSTASEAPESTSGTGSKAPVTAAGATESTPGDSSPVSWQSIGSWLWILLLVACLIIAYRLLHRRR